ncbi:MAG TPA: hypothetical protein VK177_16885 [Flavobacteriales bacterium]|nr:hypothetical protein [Flavobacteriales bacterium]
MKYFFYTICILIFSCGNHEEKLHDKTQNRKSSSATPKVLDSVILSKEEYLNFGDFGNKIKKDTAYVFHYLIHNNEKNADAHRTYVTFSSNIPRIKIAGDSFNAKIFNVGDLNGDSIDEVLILPGSLNGCWGYQSVLALVNNNWVELANESAYGCNEENRVTKINNKQFDILIDTGAGGSGHYFKRITIK